MSLRGKPGCPNCEGRGVVLDPDPLQPARVCSCTATLEAEASLLGIPVRYRGASFEGFWEWWKGQHPKEKVIQLLVAALQLMDQADARGTLAEEMRSMLDLTLHRCGARMQPNGEVAWKDLKPAQEPHGYRALINWTKHDRERVDLWWLDGPAGSGRSTLAAAALKAWCSRSGHPGRFVSLRTLGQELKDLYYDSRSFTNVDFLSERDRMDSDIRVVRAIAQLLDQRYSEEQPTILTASRWVSGLQSGGPEALPLLRLEDPSLIQRLQQAKRVALRPTLERLMGSVNG